MNEELYKKIANSSAYRASRDENANEILSNPHLFCDLVAIALNTSDAHHFKACWIMEIVLEQQLFLLTGFLNTFCDQLPHYNNESALRSISKICLFISQHLALSPQQEEQITESSLDWLIDEKRKVATKAYAIRTLFELGKTRKWIYPELKRILTDDYGKYSAGYQAVAKEIVKKIK
ncbi:hypothetical protein [Flavobacterium sp.]|uniref:hypothetical protein n=1 Tax=Flavobacterium sp. TaxID=239 RepID=UPI00262B4A7C|nr:hypothetical protein [Flavobacterium sp.]MDG2433933.1 hypothetical protein [Flavobacterium sp.]